MAGYSVAIVIALREEYDVFCDSLRSIKVNASRIDQRPLLGEESCGFVLTGSNGLSVRCIVFCVDEMGAKKASVVTKKVIENLSPKLVINIGIAGRYNDDFSLGDIIIGDTIDDYVENSKISEIDDDIKFEFSGNAGRTTYGLSKFIRVNGDKIKSMTLNTKDENVYTGKNEIALGLKERINKSEVRVTMASIASGPFVSASVQFKEIVLAKDRNFSCVEMESCGVLDTCHEMYPPVDCIVMKTISDYADKDKSKLDKIRKGWIRKSVMEYLSHFTLNSIILLNEFWTKSFPICQCVENVPRKDNISVDEYIDMYHLNRYFTGGKCNSINRASFSKFFSLVVRHKINESNLFESLASSAIESHSTFSAIIYGEKGTGKSSFMAILYGVLKDKLRDTDIEPVYFNLSRSIKSRSSMLYPEDASVLESIVDEIDMYLTGLSPNVFLILDGVDESFYKKGSSKNKMLNRLVSKIKSIKIEKVILGSSGLDVVGKLQLCNFIDVDEPENTVELKKVHSKSSDLSGLVEKFVTISLNDQSRITAKDLMDAISKFKLFSVDLFILSLLHRNLNKQKFSRHNTFSGFLGDYCISKLQKVSDVGTNAEDVLPLAAREAFCDFVGDHLNSVSNYIMVLGCHSSIRNYLIAYHIVNSILGLGEDVDIKMFRYVFTDELNNFIKEQINASSKVSDNAVNSLIALGSRIKESDDLRPSEQFRGLTHVCYLVGRIERTALHSRCKEFLHSMKNDVLRMSADDSTNTSSPDFGLLVRTIYISLAYLGVESEMNEYLDRLFNEPAEENLNRGFHMEYYGDIPSNPNISMNHRDEGQNCSMTLNHIAYKIYNIDNYSSRLIEIEVHTLLSLIQDRHAKGTLPISIEEASGIVETLISKNIIKHEKLKHYSQAVYKNLQFPMYRSFKIINDLYMAKYLPRTGWVNRASDPTLRLESVAEHSFGALLIAQFFLSSKLVDNDETFDKHKVLSILLIHDIAEAFTGDIVDKNETDIQNEMSWMAYISLSGMYFQMPETADILNLYNEYKNRTTIEGEIARDIDKLETIFQAHVYRSEGIISESDFKEFYSNNIQLIKTNTVKSIFAKVQSYIDIDLKHHVDMKWPFEIVPVVPTF